MEYVTPICHRLAGGESLHSICADPGMPSKSTVLLWVVTGREIEDFENTDDRSFSDHYMRAREAGGFSHGDRVIDTVDKVASGEVDPQSARAMLDGLKWAAERMASKHHSARQEHDHTSSDKSMSPNPTRIELVSPNDHSTDTDPS